MEGAPPLPAGNPPPLPPPPPLPAESLSSVTAAGGQESSDGSSRFGEFPRQAAVFEAGEAGSSPLRAPGESSRKSQQSAGRFSLGGRQSPAHGKSSPQQSRQFSRETSRLGPPAARPPESGRRSSVSPQHSPPSTARESSPVAKTPGLGSQALGKSPQHVADPPGKCPQQAPRPAPKRTRTVAELPSVARAPCKARTLRAEQSIPNTVVVENLSPDVGAKVVAAGLSQFGQVVRVVKHVHPSGRTTGRVSVEMANEANAENLIYQAAHSLLLLGSVPRPVHIRSATDTIRRGVPVPVTVTADGTKVKETPRIIRSDLHDKMFQLRNLRYKHLMQFMWLDRAQVEEAKKLHFEQEIQVERYLAVKDDLEIKAPLLARLMDLYRS